MIFKAIPTQIILGFYKMHSHDLLAKQLEGEAGLMLS